MTSDDLYRVDLAEFVAARDALVKKLKAEGDKEGAAAVKALRKPSTVAWGINRVIHMHPDDVDELIHAAGAVRTAQMRAVQGNDAGGLREASKSWRAKINQLAAAVATLVGDHYRDEAAATFEASSVDQDLTEVLKVGRFSAAVVAASFGLAGMPDPPDRVPDPVAVSVRKPVVPPTAEPAPVPELDEGALAQARDALGARDRDLEKALYRLRRAEQRLDQAREAVDEARLAHSDAQVAREAAAQVVAAFPSA